MDVSKYNKHTEEERLSRVHLAHITYTQHIHTGQTCWLLIFTHDPIIWASHGKMAHARTQLTWGIRWALIRVQLLPFGIRRSIYKMIGHIRRQQQSRCPSSSSSVYKAECCGRPNRNCTALLLLLLTIIMPSQERTTTFGYLIMTITIIIIILIANDKYYAQHGAHALPKGWIARMKKRRQIVDVPCVRESMHLTRHIFVEQQTKCQPSAIMKPD